METVLVAKQGGEPQACINTPEAIAYAQSLGYRLIHAPSGPVPPVADNEVYVTKDGGRTIERCMKDQLQYARGLGYSLATQFVLQRHGKGKPPASPAPGEMVRPTPAISAPAQAQGRKRY